MSSIKFNEYTYLMIRISYWLLKENKSFKKRTNYSHGKQKLTFAELKKKVLANKTKYNTTVLLGRIAEYAIIDNSSTDFLPEYVTGSKGKKYSKSQFVNMCKWTIAYEKKEGHRPETIDVNVKVSTASSKKIACKNPFISSPHYLNQGAGALGQITPYDCGPHCIHQGLRKFGVTNISESELMSYCGTTTSGTSHDGILTGIAKAAKKAGINIKTEWKNYSDFGKTDAERMKSLGELMCKKNVFLFFHLWYSASGSDIDDKNGCGHYEAIDKINIKTGYVRALNSLGSRCSYPGYCGHLQDRKFSIQSHYIKGISQKSVCIMTKI
ncbi:hypothetical protein [Methanobrevibacter sp.]|uniref:hypothetical protein n=1 Tax=Methanobrevibacter sp. TaxID=66852 RepID=UPI0038906D82